MLSQCLLQRPGRLCIPRLHPITRSARYATHRDVSAARQFRPSPIASRRSPLPYSTLARPLLFTVLFSGTTFGIAYYADTHNYALSRVLGVDDAWSVMTGVMALNALVFAAHQVPVSANSSGRFLYGVLQRYGFMDIRQVQQYPLSVLTSGFSHTQIWHLGLNMVGLYTVGNSLMPLMGGNQFLAFYTSSICWSSMAQLSLELARARRGKLAMPSLGASGGVYALLGAVAWYAPDASVYLLFLPFIPLKLGYTFAGMVAFDTYGLLAGWRSFGHAAHLAGGMTGLLYGVAGVPEAWMAKRRESMRRHLSRYGR